MSGNDIFRITFFARPKCCKTDETWRDWVKQSRVCSPGPLSFCADCDQQYASKMRALNLCEHTYVEFGKDGESFVPQKTKDAIVLERRRSRMKDE